MSHKRLFLCGILAGLVIISSYVQATRAQCIGVTCGSRQSIAKVSSNPRPRPAVAPKARAVVKVVTKTQIVTRTEIKNRVVMEKTTNLAINTQPNATVTLIIGGGATPRTMKAPADGVVIFENIAPGNYELAATLEGYTSKETDVVVPRGVTTGVSLELDPITHQLTIETNINAGEVRFAPAKVTKRNADGTFETEETRGYCIVPIKDRTATIKDMPEGFYNIDIRPSAIEYQPVLAVVNLPDDITDENATSANAQNYRVNLEKKLSDQPFAANWVSGEWQMPANWNLDKKMKVSGAGAALPQNELYRYYADFEMRSSVRLMDNKAVGFAVRALDNQNYYLIQLTGGAASEPYLLSGYTVKNGRIDSPIVQIPINGFAGAIGDKKYFEFIVKSKGNVFETFIVDDAGDLKPTGQIVVRDNVYQKGAVGVAVKDSAQYEVGAFRVCTPTCK